MIHSLRWKIYLVMSSLILFFVCTSIFLNSTLLEKYYLFRKESSLKSTYSSLNSLFNSSGDVELEIEKLERMRGIHVVVADKDFKVIYDSMTLNRKDTDIRLNKVNNENNSNYLKSRQAEILNKKIIIENRLDKRLRTSFLNLTGLLDNGDYLLLTLPIAAIQESANVANKFFLIIGILTLLSGFLFSYFISKKLTDPIIQLNGIALKMSSLDFSKRYTGKSKDEIGELGVSINTLSEKLESTIAELVEANNKLQSDIENERRIDTMRKEFVSNVSHELKTPIALIQGYAEGLMINVNDDEEDKNFYCEVIMDEAAKMNRLVKELLELSIIESGQASLELSTFEISGLAALVVKKNMLLLKEKGIVPEVAIPENIRINSDYDKIERVLVNYFTNAINHVDDKGIIGIKSEVRDKKVRVITYNSGQHISKEDMEKIWISFYKADKARTRDYGGTGLGLSIVKALLDLHGYSYGVDNVKGGVEFWFEADVFE